MKLSSPPTRYAFTSVIAQAMKYGPSKVPRIAYELDMPVETCRYYLKRFHEMGFRFLPVVDYWALGLQPCVLFIRFSKKLDPQKRENFLRWLETLYTIYRAALGYELEYYFEVVPPQGNVKTLKKMIENLCEAGVLENFKLSQVVDGYYMPLWIKFYDFTRGCWNGAVELDIPKVLIRNTSSTCNFDHVDLHLISYLEENPTAKMIDISQKLGTSPQLLSYHREKHIEGGRLVTGYVPFRRTRLEDMRIEIVMAYLGEQISDYLHYLIYTDDNYGYIRLHVPIKTEIELKFANSFSVNPLDVVRFTIPVEHYVAENWTPLNTFEESLEKMIRIV
jgi:DNA-binding Lrp family transcriptional regulator